jgi:hypothetical protein
VTTAPTCARCGQLLADGAVICRQDAQSLADALLAGAGHAEDAWTVIARQARYGTASRGARSEPLPVDLTAAERLAAAANTMATWARHVCEERGTELPARRPLLGPFCLPGCEHTSCAGARRRLPPSDLAEAAAWLATQVDWLRKRPEAGEAFDELHDACSILARLVDRPGTAGLRLVGMCDCGKILYAPHGRDVVQCKPCGARWNVTESQEILLGHLDGKLVTVPEALDMAGWLDTDRTREQIRKLLTGWIHSGRLVGHGQVLRDPTEAELRDDPDIGLVAVPTYRFGEIRDRLGATPRRNREGAAA